MTYHFSGIVEKVLPSTGMWAYRQRIIIVGGIAFTLKDNNSKLVSDDDVGKPVQLTFRIVSYKSKTHDDKYYTYVIVDSLTF